MALALARRYRPKTFADVAVQSHVAATLKGAIASGRVAHGYLLAGPRGVGKTTLARVLAMALNCERRGDPALGGEPCGECASCLRIWSGASSLDVVEIDAASNRGVDDARDLRERAMYAPSGEDRYKVYIVDEAHMLTREAWNALLKILEEPPPRVVFVFATTEPQKIAQSAAPVLSRLQRFDFKRIGAADIRARLERVLRDEGIAFEADALAMIARAADGSMRDALSLTDQVLAMGADAVVPDRVREALGLVAEDELVALLDLLAEHRAGDVFGFVARLADAGIDLGQFLSGLTDLLRAQLAIALGGEPPDVSEGTREALEARRDAFAAADLLRMLSIATELEPRFRRSGQQQLLLEAMLVRFALLDRAVSLEAVLRGLGGGSSGRDEEEAARPVRRGATPAPPTSEVPKHSEARERAVTPRSTAPRADAPASDARTDRPPVVRDADRAPKAAPPESAPPDLHQLVERWDDLVAAMRAAGKSVAATALEHGSPDSVNARGDVALALDDANPIYERAIDAAKADVVAQLRAWFPGVQRIVVRAPQGAATPPARLTDEMVRAERMSALRRKDPVLDAAIDALDLDLAD
ncbi:MAG TPA: DNA polymerase III subunit gamma/tau [Gemmatimonadaceae bacterium]|jgi:DNA polymerase-3 subunit gamma/tau|nr:DNA polymerase III subunit gamma/tau [Gemmatimonadaceae bacterium]